MKVKAYVFLTLIFIYKCSLSQKNIGGIYMVNQLIENEGLIKFPKAKINIGPIQQLVSWNYFEGTRLRIGVDKNSFISKNIELTSHLAYGSKDNEYKYGVELKAYFRDSIQRYTSLSVGAKNDYAQFNTVRLPFDNIAFSLIRPNLYRDLMKKETIYANVSRTLSNQFSVILESNYNKYYGNEIYKLEQKDSIGSLISNSNLNTSNLDFSLLYFPKAKIIVDTSKNQVQVKYKSNYFPNITLNYKMGLNGIFNSNYKYQGLSLKFHKTNYIQKIGGSFDYSITIKKYFGDIPYVETNISQGNNGYLLDYSKFVVMNETEFISDQSIQLNLKQSFRKFLINRFKPFRQSRETIWFNGIFGSYETKNELIIPHYFSEPNPIYAEVGYGISKIFNFINIDFGFRLTQLEKTNSRNFNVLLSTSFEL